MARHRPNPPAARLGVSPSCVVLPNLPDGPWQTMGDFLIQRFTGVPASVWRQRLQHGDVIDDAGQVITTSTPFQARRRLYYFRAVPHEPRIPFEEVVLWRDDHLLVVDKPHFLPVMPSGKYLQETVLVRLKNKLGLPDLAPIHRIDRDTAGLVLFSIQSATRDAYHALFRRREVSKTYEAIAPWNAALLWPMRRESRIEASGHFFQQTEVPGEANALTFIQPFEVIVGEKVGVGEVARYQLKPVTGQRHQLRVHMAALGLPIVGDGIYPTLTPEGQVDFEWPLQLLAKSIEFLDPLNGAKRHFTSQRQLLF